MKVLAEVRAHAQKRPDHPALVVSGDPDLTISYAELVASADAIAAELRAAGVAPGDRCGLRAKQGPLFVENALAILMARACLVPLPEDTVGEALDEAIRECALQALVEAMPERTLLRCDGEAPSAAFRALEPAYMRFTSGTTSERKGVIVGADAVLDRLENANDLLGISPSDRILWLLPMAHHFLVSILLYLRFGATILLPRSSLANEVLAFAERARATVFYASPYHYNLLAKDASQIGLSSVRLAVSTADGLRDDVARRFRERFGFPLVQALGIIEVGLSVVNVESAESKPTALGRPARGYDVWLRDEHGKRLEQSDPERTGEVCIRGTGLFDAYLRPFTTREALLADSDGSFRTGDQGWFDGDGDLHLAGRRHNRINMAGMKFFCEEVEDALDSHPAIRASRVYAREHAHLGQIPAAELELVEGAAALSRKELTAYLRTRLAGYKIPRQFDLTEHLVRTPTGKVRRWHGADPDTDPEV